VEELSQLLSLASSSSSSPETPLAAVRAMPTLDGFSPSLSPRPERQAHTEDDGIEQERIEMLMEVYRAFDIDQNGGVGEAEMFVLGTARRQLGHKSTPWTVERNAKMVSHMNVDPVTRHISADNFVSYFNGKLPDEPEKFRLTVGEFLLCAHSLRTQKLEQRAAAELEQPEPEPAPAPSLGDTSFPLFESLAAQQEPEVPSAQPEAALEAPGSPNGLLEFPLFSHGLERMSHEREFAHVSQSAQVYL